MIPQNLTQTVALEGDTSPDNAIFGLQILPACDSIQLSWQNYVGATSYQIVRDGKVLAQAGEAESIWIDDDHGGNEHTYQIRAIGGMNKVMAESWEITGKPNCSDYSESDTVLEYTLGSAMYTVNGHTKGPMDATPEIANGRMFLVIRYVTQEVGALLDWVASERKLVITTQSSKVIELWVDKPEARVDGVKMMIDPQDPNVVPYINNGRTLLPMRYVAEQLGATDEKDIVWNGETKSVTLMIPKTDATKPKVSCLTVLNADESRWLLECIDSNRNHVNVLLNSNNSGLSSNLGLGDMIKISGEPVVVNKFTVEIEPALIEAISQEVSIVKGFPSQVKDGKLKFASDPGNTYSYDDAISAIESSENKYAIKIATSSDSSHILWWEPVALDSIKTSTNIITNSVFVSRIDHDKKRLEVRYDDGEIRYKDWMYFPIGFKFEKLDLTFCYLVNFSINYLGNRIAKPLIKQGDCLVPFDIESLTGPRLLYPEAKSYREFNIINSDEKNRDYEVTFTIESNDVETELQREYVKVEKNDYLTVSYPFTAPATTGDFTVTLTVQTGTTIKSSSVDMRCEDIDFTIGLTSSKNEYPLNEEVELMLKVTNRFDCPLPITFQWSVTDNALDIPLDWEKETVPEKYTLEHMLNVYWLDVASVGEQVSLSVEVESQYASESSAITLTPTDYIPPIITIQSLDNTKEKITSIFGEVDWLRLEPEKIIVDWGDGQISEGKNFPFDHQYESWGEYSINIQAVSVEGAVGEWSDKYACQKPPPQPPEITKVEVFETMPKDYAIRMKVNVDWKDASEPGMIVIDWGHDDITKHETSSISHVFPRESGTYIVEMKAVTKNGSVESDSVKYKFVVLQRMILAVRIE
jgi:hypothetical protein